MNPGKVVDFPLPALSKTNQTKKDAK